MLEKCFKRPAVLRGHRDGLLGPYLDSFVALAEKLGYPPKTMRRQCLVLRDLGGWMERRGLSIVHLDEALSQSYLADRGHRGIVRTTRACIGLFIGHLRELDVLAPPMPPDEPSAVERLMARYRSYLSSERGVVPTTIDRYMRVARRFLAERFGDGPLHLSELQTSDISGFVLRWAHCSSPKGAKVMVTALRSFLRFLLANAEIAQDLVPAVPTVLQWRRTSVPKYLTHDQLERLLETCDRDCALGRRDYAILLLLIRLGLRAGEIAALVLEDINWRAGEISVLGKGQVRERLPLPNEVGAAIAVYLSQDRPKCSTRRIFIRARAPHHGFSRGAAITSVVTMAVRKAGLEPPVRGAHLLRHSLATQMLRAGASMAEIGRVLRHRSPATTEIYAKVDFDTLRPLAQAWPSGGGMQ